jgi:hypothetical protein
VAKVQSDEGRKESEYAMTQNATAPCRHCGNTTRPKRIRGRAIECQRRTRCKECLAGICIRAGRNLCRICWNDPVVRRRHPIVAPFASPQAAAMGAKIVSPSMVTVAIIEDRDKADATILACKLRNGLLAGLESQGLVRRPMAGHDDMSMESEEWYVAMSEIAERLTMMLRRAGVPDERSDACKAVRAELASA